LAVHTLSASGICTLCSLKYVCFAAGERTVLSVATDEGVLRIPGVLTWHVPSPVLPVSLFIVLLVYSCRKIKYNTIHIVNSFNKKSETRHVIKQIIPFASYTIFF
jgi:hypothetical protein